MVAELSLGDLFGIWGCAAMANEPVLDEGSADALAMARLAQGDIDALGELYDRHQGAIRRLAVRMTGSADDGDDIVHATFLAAMTTAGAFDPTRSCRAWLLGIAARLIQRQRSKGARWARLLGAFRPAEPAWAADPERAVGTRQDLGRVEQALLGLSDAKRLVLIMSELEGLKGEEIARALGIPVATVWTRLHHARRELLAALNPGEEP